MGVKAIKPSVSALFSAKRLSMKGDRCMHGQPSTSSLAGRPPSVLAKFMALLYM
jgi:hypothetical protein